MDRPEKQTAVICTKQRPGGHQRNGTRSQLSRRREASVVVDAAEKDWIEAPISEEDQALVMTRSVNRRESPVCVAAVETKQRRTSVSSRIRSSLLTGSDKENCPVPRDGRNARKEPRLGRRSQDARRSRRRGLRADEPRSHARACSRERGNGRREGSRKLVSGVRERKEGALQSGRELKRRHRGERSRRVLKRAREEPAEAVGFDTQSSSRRALSEVRLSGRVSSPAREWEGCGESFSDVSDDDSCQEEFDRHLRKESHGEDRISSGTESGRTERRQSTSQEDFDCELFATNEHLPSLDIEAISESDSEADPMELTIVAEPVSNVRNVSEATEGLKTSVLSTVSPVPLPRDGELAVKLPRESVGREPITADTEPLLLHSPLQEMYMYSGKSVSVSNEEEDRDDWSSTGGDGSTAVGTIERDSSLESFPEISVDLLSPLPLSQESDSSDDITMMSPFPYENIVPLSPLPPSRELATPTGSATPPRADSAFHDKEQSTAHDCSTSVPMHSLPNDSLLSQLPFSLPHCSDSSSPHANGTTAGREVSEGEGNTLGMIEVSDGGSRSCRSSKEPSPCGSSRLPSSGTEREEGELISEDEEDTASTASSSACSKTSAGSAPTIPAGNGTCKVLKSSGKTERSWYRNVSSKGSSSKEPTGQNHYRPSSDRTDLRNHKKYSRRPPTRREARKSCDSECHGMQKSHDPEGYRLQRSCDSNSHRTQRSCDSLRSHDLEGYRRRKSRDLEGYRYRSQNHRAPRREVLHSGRDHHPPHSRASDSKLKLLRRH